MLMKQIVDAVFRISGELIDEINRDPEKLFETLGDYREKWSTIESLVDQLIVSNLGIETFLKISEMDSYEERLAIAALVELSTGVIVEERFKLAEKLGRSIKLTPDKNFGREYDRVMGGQQGEMDGVFEETSRSLQEQTAKDKQLAKLGIKKPINTNDENRNLGNV